MMFREILPVIKAHIRGGGAGIFLKKIVCFRKGTKKINVFNEVKNKKFVLHSVNFFKALFP